MSEVKRWNLLAEWDRSREGKIEAWIRDLPSMTGAWVLYADHIATVEALKKRIEELEGKCERLTGVASEAMATIQRISERGEE